MEHVYDVQVLHSLRTSGPNDKYVKGLQSCLDSCEVVPPLEVGNLRLLKEAGRRLFAPELGGSYAVWNKRPLPPLLIDYAVADVRFLLEIKRRYGSPALNPMVLNLTEERITKAVRGCKPATGEHMSLRDFQVPGVPFGHGSRGVPSLQQRHRMHSDSDYDPHDYDDHGVFDDDPPDHHDHASHDYHDFNEDNRWPDIAPDGYIDSSGNEW